MADQRGDGGGRRFGPQDVWKVLLALIGVAAVLQELKKPPTDRTWHGKVADVVPYDFRMPTVERARTTFWNPDGPLVSPRLWGVGWSPNFGAIKRRIEAATG